MGSLPVQFPAARAPQVVGPPRGHARRNPRADCLAIHGHKEASAGQAPRERPDLIGQVEPPHDLPRLGDGVGGPDPIPVSHRAAFEERAVPGEDDPPLAGRRCDEILILAPRGVTRVEPKEPQVAGKLSQMAIEEERGPAERLPPYAEKARNVEALELRVHREPVAIAEAGRELHRLSVEEDELDLDVGHPERFDRVFDCWRPLKGVGDLPLAPPRGEEVVQFPVHPNCGPGHGSVGPPLRPGQPQGMRKMAFARSTLSTVNTIWFFSTVQ